MKKVFCDKIDDKIVSSLILYFVDLPSRKLGVIEEIFTAKEYRNQGRASKLIKEAIEYAKEIGLDCIELTCDSRLQGFYESHGFYNRFQTSMRYKITEKIT